MRLPAFDDAAEKNTNMSLKLPTIWMNVTTTANWNRPAVGIVRVEQSLCAALQLIVPESRFKQCVWRDGKFVEQFEKLNLPDKKARSKIEEKSDVMRTVDALLPNSPAMLPARAELHRALQALLIEQGIDEDGEDTLLLSIPVSSEAQALESGPTCGDVIVTVGTDWDQAYNNEFFDMRKRLGLKLITCCHDIIPVLYPQYCVADVARQFKEYFTRLLWSSAGILCFSEQSKRDLTWFSNSIGAPYRTMIGGHISLAPLFLTPQFWPDDR